MIYIASRVLLVACVIAASAGPLATGDVRSCLTPDKDCIAQIDRAPHELLPHEFGSPSKAFIYEETPNAPYYRRFLGSTVWRSDQIAAAGQSSEIAVRAESQIPEQHISFQWSLRRNQDKALPASHIVEIIFTLRRDFLHGDIQNVPGVLMKQGEVTRGIPLAALAVKVTANYFRIGLSSINADMQRNIPLLTECFWFDMPVVYRDGQRAIITVEKGVSGQRAFGEAFAAWGGHKT
jgi:hypothetical protein